MLGGTILDVVFVVDLAVVVVDDDVVAAGALFPLFLRNHAQDHLAHLEQRITYKYDQQYWENNNSNIQI